MDISIYTHQIKSSPLQYSNISQCYAGRSFICMKELSGHRKLPKQRKQDKYQGSQATVSSMEDSGLFMI